MIRCSSQSKIVFCLVLIASLPMRVHAAEVIDPPSHDALPNLAAGALSFSHMTETPPVAAVPGDRATVDTTPQEQAMIPLPSGGKTGMAMLAILSLYACRKSIVRFVT